MTSKQRAYLKSLAMTMDPIFQIGKGSLTPENTQAIAEALEARELIKISVLQNCLDDPRVLAEMIAERTRSQVVQVIVKKLSSTKRGKKIRKRLSYHKEEGIMSEKKRRKVGIMAAPSIRSMWGI